MSSAIQRTFVKKCGLHITKLMLGNLPGLNRYFLQMHFVHTAYVVHEQSSLSFFGRQKSCPDFFFGHVFLVEVIPLMASPVFSPVFLTRAIKNSYFQPEIIRCSVMIDKLHQIRAFLPNPALSERQEIMILFCVLESVPSQTAKQSIPLGSNSISSGNPSPQFVKGDLIFHMKRMVYLPQFIILSLTLSGLIVV